MISHQTAGDDGAHGCAHVAELVQQRKELVGLLDGGLVALEQLLRGGRHRGNAGQGRV